MTRPRWALGAVGAILLLQFAFSMVFEEPYPALRYPSFAFVYDLEDSIGVTRPEITVEFGDGQTMSLEAEDLFRDLPRSFTPSVIETIDEKVRGVPVTQGVKLGGFRYEIVRSPVVKPATYREFLEWMKDQVASLTGRDDARVLTIDFFRLEVFVDESPVRESRELERSTSIDLTEVDTS